METIINLAEHQNLFGDTVSAPASIDRDLLASVLHQTMSGLSLSEFVALLTNQYKEVMEYAGLCIGEKACQKTSLLFNPHRLDTRTSSSKASIFEAIKQPGFHRGLARASIFKKGLVSELLYQVIQLGVNGVQYVNEFPPHIARDLCKQYGLSKSSAVLDPCGGWGGRMLGASVMCDSYTCYEPSKRTAAGLKELATFIRRFRPSFQANVVCLPFEENEDDDLYDLAITSPPYFDTEHYSDEPTNSLNRYKGFDSWCSGFYLPMVEKTMRRLAGGAGFIVNIGDRKWPLSKRLIEFSAGRYQVKRLPNLLSGASGFGKEGADGEVFYEIRNL